MQIDFRPINPLKVDEVVGFMLQRVGAARAEQMTLEQRARYLKMFTYGFSAQAIMDNPANFYIFRAHFFPFMPQYVRDSTSFHAAYSGALASTIFADWGDELKNYHLDWMALISWHVQAPLFARETYADGIFFDAATVDRALWVFNACIESVMSSAWGARITRADELAAFAPLLDRLELAGARTAVMCALPADASARLPPLGRVFDVVHIEAARADALERFNEMQPAAVARQRLSMRAGNVVHAWLKSGDGWVAMRPKEVKAA